MVEVKWTDNALNELDDYANYISKDSPKYARILVKQIYEIIGHLNQFPKFGRKVPEYDDSSLREIIFKNYRIIYLIKSYHIEIISVIHGSKLLKI